MIFCNFSEILSLPIDRTKWRLELGMFCKLPRTVSSAHLMQSAARILLLHLLSLLLNRVTKTLVTDLTGKTQKTPSFLRRPVKRFLEANKLPHKESYHVALSLICTLCERETSQTASSSTRRPQDWCALRARSTVSWAALVD